MSKRRHNFGTKRFKGKSLFIFHARIVLKSLILLFIRLIARGARIAGADLEHNLGGGGKSMQEVLAEPAGKGAGRCPLLRAKRGSFDFF